MNPFTIFLFGISANLDSLLIAISYGLKNVHITFKAKVIVALISFFGAFLSRFAANSLTNILPAGLTGAIGSTMLVILGLMSIWKYAKDRKSTKSEDTSAFDKDNNQRIDAKEAVYFGLALSINNFGLGIAVFIAGYSFLPVALSSAFFNFIFLYVGYWLGNGCLSRVLGRYGELVSGVIIILIGLYGFY